LQYCGSNGKSMKHGVAHSKEKSTVVGIIEAVFARLVRFILLPLVTLSQTVGSL
jgi:hypothetical protein